MSALQDRIDDEIKNLAAAVIIDEVCHDKEFSGQDKCKKCRFNCLLNRDNYTSLDPESDKRSYLSQIIESCSRFIYDDGKSELDDEEQAELLTHIDNLNADEFYKEAEPYQNTAKQINNKIQLYKNNNIADTECDDKHPFDSLRDYIAADMKDVLSSSNTISLSAYLLFNNFYEEEWYELSVIE